jgi:hypothetical protein
MTDFKGEIYSMVQRLKDKFTLEEVKDIDKRINKLFYNATHYKTRTNSNEAENELLHVVDHLCRVSNMLCDMIECEMEGHIECADPHDYIDGKLGLAEAWMNNYVNNKRINLNED